MGLAGCCVFSLAWTLAGTVVSADASLAILRTADGAQTIVSPGDRIDGCTIGPVARESVLIECGGETHSVELHGVPAGDGAAEPTAGRQVFSLHAHEFRALLEDRQRLAAQLSLEPAVDGGYLYGYRIAALDPAGDLAGLGIAEGDVITDVNGAPASEPHAFVQTIDALAGQPAFSIGIERAGVRFSLDYVLDSSSRLP